MKTSRSVLASWALACQGFLGSVSAAQSPVDVASAGELPLQSSLATQAAFEAAFVNQSLYLQTFINGMDSQQVSPYRLQGGSLFADLGELERLGFNIPERLIGPGGRVELSRIPGLVYRLDTLRQLVEITVDPELLQVHRYDGSADRIRPTVSPGVTLNYDLYAQSSGGDALGAGYELYSGFLDFRAFANVGALTQTGVVRHVEPAAQDSTNTLRLDSTFVRSDTEDLDTFRAGDLISGAKLGWVTPVRLGGLQWQRNFQLQPNLLTYPAPTVSGSAAVPSTVDVLVNNVQQYSRAVEPGPFTIDNLPLVTGQGELRVVVRDAQGRELVTTLPFYASPNLLKPGLLDFSFESGFLRRNYAVTSNDYDRRLAGVGSVRAGVLEWLTVEAHAEGLAELVEGGLGAVVKLGPAGTASASAAESSTVGSNGTQWSAGYQWNTSWLAISASTQRSDEQFRTLADVSGLPVGRREISQVSTSTTLGGGGLSLGYIVVRGGGVLATPQAFSPTTTTRLATISYSLGMNGGMSVYGALSRDFDNPENTTASIGLSYYMGNRVSTSVAGQFRKDAMSAVMQATEPLPADGTGLGWRVQGNTGETGGLAAAGGYRMRQATFEIGGSESGNSKMAFADLRGSVVSMDYRRLPILSNPIFSSFALVDTGLPNVGVLFENREVGRSDASGLLLIPNLTAQTRNQIAIDPRDVPLDADVERVRDVAVPLDRGGVLVRFPVAKADNASVLLQLSSGSPVPLGASVTLNGDESFIVGYDGQAYLKHVGAHNELRAEWAGGKCTASFEFRTAPNALRNIGPLRCTEMD